MKVTADDILSALTSKSTSDVVFIPELRLGSGYGDVAQRRIDLFKVETAPSKGYLATAYEIKVSRGDFFNDVKKPKKQRGARVFSDQFYYVTPPDLVTVDEVPEWAGLIEFHPDADTWNKLKKIIPAPRLDKARPTWGLFVSGIRNVSGISAETTAQNKVFELQQEIMTLKNQLAYQKQTSPTRASESGSE